MRRSLLGQGPDAAAGGRRPVGQVPGNLSTTIAVGLTQDGGDEPAGILLAEDYLINRMTVEMILGDLPVRLTSVENGQDAVAAWKPQRFALILMDIQMPVMDGLTAIRIIREREAMSGAARTPICMLTANTFAEHRQAAMAAGADHFLPKPIGASALISLVQDILDHGHSERDRLSD